MRWIWLLVVILFSTLAAGDSIDYQAAGTLAAGTAHVAGALKRGHTWSVTDMLLQIDDLTTHKNQTGNLGSIDLTTGVLFKCAAGLCFHGGSLDIDGTHHNSIFDSAFSSGTVSFSKGTDIVNARMTNGAAVVIKTKAGAFSTQALVQSAVIPEPATLGLMGTGLLGLGFAGWRKCYARV